jgi:DNA/RNA-binding domain of Phe-tRNA-synthetase-like protein
MSDNAASAEIIPFPMRAVPVAAEPELPQADVVAGPVDDAAPDAGLDPQERLRRALLQLDAALAEQRTAVTAWRAALADLGGSVNGLRGSFETLQGRLDSLKTQLQR